MSAMWKLEKDLCRCCHAEGSFKHLSDPCFLLGQEEIYSVMLQDCLDIKIVPMTGPLCDATYTICESCVARLRDASNFKRQVQDCEERFKEMYSKNMIKGFAVKDEPCESDADMKQEFQSVEEDEDDDDAFMKFDDEGDDASSYEEHEEMISVEIEAESSAKGKGKAKAKPKPKPKKAPVKKTKSKEKPIKVETEELTEAAVSGEKKKGPFVEEELRLLPYVSIIENAGAKKKYMCVLCDNRPVTAYTMKRHVITRHTDVKCSICQEEFTTTQKKNDHLVNTHKIEVESNKTVIENSKCTCDICKKQYTSKKGLQNHIFKMHTLRKCPDCPLMLTDRELSMHRNDVHKTPIPTCGICGYRNKKTCLLLLHQRQVHLRERTVPCEFCNLTFFNIKHLKRHLIRHKPEKIHECGWCHKKFPRKTTLRMHEKIHKGEKNKVCELCGERFVQKASLNYHMVKHHPDAC